MTEGMKNESVNVEDICCGVSVISINTMNKKNGLDRGINERWVKYKAK